MTAKELAEEAIEIIGSCVRLGTKYHFTESEFEDFCAQLCKEQRKIIANNLIGIAVTHPWFPLDDCVINANNARDMKTAAEYWYERFGEYP
jgi:hypothetical protein